MSSANSTPAADGTFLWQTGGNYVQLAPGAAHVMHVR